MDTAITQEAPKIGAWKGGLLLARASLSVLRLHKKMVLFPFFSAVAIIGFLILFIIIATNGMNSNDWEIFIKAMESEQAPAASVVDQLLGIFLLFSGYYIIVLIINFFTAALTAVALKHFDGGNPTIAYGIKRAMDRFWPIAKFSLLSSTVGMVLRGLSERLPFSGRITAYLGGVIWAVVTVFTIPAIVASDQPIGPIQAVKQSADIFQKVWPKNFAGKIGMGLVFSVFFGILLIFIVISSILGVVSSWSFFIAIPIIMILCILFGAVAESLNGIFHAALYRYAQTGESPAQFDKNLLRAAFRPNKKWFA